MKKERYKKPRTEWITVQREELRIVPDDVWNAAQANRPTVAKRGFAHGKKRAGYALTGMVVCGKCGGPVAGHYQQSKNGSNRYYYYRCRRAMNGAGLCENKTKLRGKQFETAVVGAVEQQLLCEDFFCLVARELMKLDEAKRVAHQNQDAQRRRLAELDLEIRKLTDLALQVPDLGHVAAELRRRKEEMEAIKQALSAGAQQSAELTFKEALDEVRKRAGKTIAMVREANDVS